MKNKKKINIKEENEDRQGRSRWVVYIKKRLMTRKIESKMGERLGGKDFVL